MLGDAVSGGASVGSGSVFDAGAEKLMVDLHSAVVEISLRRSTRETVLAAVM
jgi:hypothetical protein